MSKKNKEEIYAQCLLSSDEINNLGTQIEVPLDGSSPPRTTEVAWIPAEWAKKGQQGYIKGLNGLWVVEEVWGSRPLDWLKDRERDYTSQRDASDVEKVKKTMDF